MRRATHDDTPIGGPPHPLGTLVGRSAELDTIVDLVTSATTRLVTLTGPGGVGKTRLGLEAAGRLAPAFAWRVAFVDLATVSDPALVLAAVARALVIHEGVGSAAWQRLRDLIAADAWLIVLDNAEHLLAAAGDLAGLLRACPGLVMLVTSREPLHLQGEREVAVPPLALPPADAAGAQLGDAPAVALFVDAATAVAPGFALDAASAPAVVEICRRLDGLPLAIQLAAARMRVMSPQELLAQLSTGLDLGARTADLPDRHRTLRRAIEWSERLLAGPERDALRRLSVCVGGFDRAAATAIVGPDGLDLVEALVEKSLLGATVGGGATRFRMLETIREHAYERLVEDGLAAATQDAHARHYCGWTCDLADALAGPGQAEAMRRLDLERDNVRTAMRWLLDRGDAELAGRTAGSLWLYWGMTGDLREGAAWAGEAIRRGAALTAQTRASALLVIGMARLMEGAYEAAGEPLAESLALSDGWADARPAALALLFLGRAEEAAARFASTGDAAGESFALASLAEQQVMDGQLERAATTYTAALDRARTADDRRAIAHALDGLGYVSLLRGRPGDATSCLEESARICLDLGHVSGLWNPLLDLAYVHQLAGDPIRAATILGAVDALMLRQGAVIGEEHRLILERLEASLAATLSAAAREDARADGRRLGAAGAVGLAIAPARSPDAAPGRRGPDALTPREREVAALVGRGLTSREIGATLFITERTADTHAERIRDKLGLRSRAEIAAWAVRHALTGGPEGDGS